MKPWPTDVILRLSKTGGLLVNVYEFLRFIDWLPRLKPTQGYLLILMTRSKYLKERYGFKGSDHVIFSRFVPGYLSDECDGREVWRYRLASVASQMAAAAEAMVDYVHHDEEGRVDSIYIIPMDGLALYIQVNPSDWVQAYRDTLADMARLAGDALRGVAEDPEKARNVALNIWKTLNRPDKIWTGALSRRAKTRFIVVDCDTHDLLREALAIVEEYVEGRPPVIYTARGGHILIDIERLKQLGRVQELFAKSKGRAGKLQHKIQSLKNAVKELRSLGRHREAEELQRELERLQEEYAKALREEGATLRARLEALAETARDENGAPLLELKKQALEPFPGTLYKGAVARFEPEKYN